MLERCMNEKPREIRVPFDTTMRNSKFLFFSSFLIQKFIKCCLFFFSGDFKCLVATTEEISNFKLPQQRIARKKMTPTCFCEQTKKIL